MRTGPSPSRPAQLIILVRWTWRSITSMRVALLLLCLLAVAAIPGSVVPQRDTNPLAAGEWAQANPTAVAWAERLGLFDVYSTPWFSAVYLLLLVSLVGCILPRTRLHVAALRSRPPAPPRRLDRLPVSRRIEVPVAPAAALDEVRRLLVKSGYRVQVHPGGVAAERGYLKETGNLLFHLAVVVVLLAVALGGLGGYRASVLVVEGSGFANTPIQYDQLSTGARFDVEDIPPFTLQIDDFTMDFVEDGPGTGGPAEFRAQGRLEPSPGAGVEDVTIRVNEPLTIDGTSVHLLNPGYAPVITVTDGEGRVVFSGAVPFLPQDENFSSTGVVKVPLPDGPDGPADIALEGLFLPTAFIGPNGPQSAFPSLRNPGLVFTAYTGDLGLDDGVPQSVYRLEKDGLDQLESAGEPFRTALGVGETAELPDGAGTVSLDAVDTWVNLQVGRNAGREVVLVGSVLAIIGLLATLFVRRRRVWAVAAQSAATPGSSTVVLAGLDRTGNEPHELEQELTRLAEQLGGTTAVSPEREGVRT